MSKPLSLCLRQLVSDTVKVRLIDLTGSLCFVEQYDFGSEIGQGARLANGTTQVATDAGVAPVDPLIAFTLVEKDLERRGCAAHVNLVNRDRQQFADVPISQVAVDDFANLKRREVSPQRQLLVATDSDIDVAMRARRLPEKKIQRPTTGNSPCAWERGHCGDYSAQVGDVD